MHGGRKRRATARAYGVLRSNVGCNKRWRIAPITRREPGIAGAPFTSRAIACPHRLRRSHIPRVARRDGTWIDPFFTWRATGAWNEGQRMARGPGGPVHPLSGRRQQWRQVRRLPEGSRPTAKLRRWADGKPKSGPGIEIAERGCRKAARFRGRKPPLGCRLGTRVPSSPRGVSPAGLEARASQGQTANLQLRCQATSDWAATSRCRETPRSAPASRSAPR